MYRIRRHVLARVGSDTRRLSNERPRHTRLLLHTQPFSTRHSSPNYYIKSIRGCVRENNLRKQVYLASPSSALAVTAARHIQAHDRHILSRAPTSRRKEKKDPLSVALQTVGLRTKTPRAAFTSSATTICSAMNRAKAPRGPTATLAIEMHRSRPLPSCGSSARDRRARRRRKTAFASAG